MRITVLRTLIASSTLLFAGFAYLCIKEHSRREALNRLYNAYHEGLKPSYDKDNVFCPQASLASDDSGLAEPYHSQEWIDGAQLDKASSLISLGQEKKAAEILEALIPEIKRDHLVQFSRLARERLALAYLRLGERNNCIAGHCSGSCIFPIQGNGLYTDPNASQKAIKEYEELLQENPQDLELRWVLNLAYMTLGEYPGKVPPSLVIPGLDTDTGSVKVKPFQDMAGDLNLNTTMNQAGGTIIDDFNNDGYLDIVTSSWDLTESMHFYKNNGDGTFTDVSKSSGLSDIKGGLNIIQADYNNDGFTDILVLRGAWLRKFGKQPLTLLRNNGNGTFTDVTIESGLLSIHPTQTATWADFNNDGLLDLFVGIETSSLDDPQPSELFINNGDGTFTDVSKESGCQQLGYMKGVTSADYNNDGWPDIFISTQDGHKILLKNKGVRSKIPQFEDVTHAAGLDNNQARTFPTWFWDYDNDGWPDIFVCGYQFGGSLATIAGAEALHMPYDKNCKMFLYRNNHDGTFTDVTDAVGLDKPVFAMGSNFGDIDNDGWLDMYLGTGNPNFTSLVPNKMFKNIGGKKFVDVTTSARVGILQKGHGVAFGDVNNDGDQDIYIETGGAFKGDAYYNSFFVNPGQNDNNWISILLEGVHSNRSAIGAHVAVSFTEDGVKRTVYRDVNSGGSFGASPLRREIGIGKAKMIDELVIKWPTTGIVQVFKDIKACQFLHIREGSDRIEKMNLKAFKFMPKAGGMNMGMSMRTH